MTLSKKSFWGRIILEEEVWAICLGAVQRRYDGYTVEELEYQGYCSVTLLLHTRKEHIKSQDRNNRNEHPPNSGVSEQLIVQLRPAQHALDLDITWAASEMYKPLAPTVRAVDVQLPGNLRAYEMSRAKGVPLSRLQLNEPRYSDALEKEETLITSFASIIAQNWPKTSRTKRRDSVLRPDSSIHHEPTMLSQCRGKVGSRIVHKLEDLADNLPDLWLRQRARTAVTELCKVEDYPIVLNHGDLIPSNILVNESTWNITGLVDWAEAEHLPFGTCMYGLEYLLGHLHAASQDPDGSGFVFCDNAPQLRSLFWTRLLELVPELVDRLEEVRLMRDVGVLLWHGYAWDEGAIDRVVDDLNDAEELTKLRAFLSVPC
jgi:hypothetical protein